MGDMPGPSGTSNNLPSVAEPIVGKKRKRSASSRDEDDDQPAVKYLELAEEFTLDRFSDEVLFEIFKHLDTLTLLSLEKTCTRFYGLVQDHRLWNHIDTMAEEKLVDEMKYILEKANNRTKTVKLNGQLATAIRENYIDPTITLDELLAATNREHHTDQRQCLIKCLLPKCENLVDLELQNVYIDFLENKIQDFPKNLKRLVFREVAVRWPDSAPTIFQKMDRSMLWLEELRVESCTWFHPYDIMLFSKCPSLKRLSMRGCQNLSDFVPYGSMAARFGFKLLEHLDMRETPITDSDLQCFNAVATLKELLLECPTYLRAKNVISTKPSASSSQLGCALYTPPSIRLATTSSDSSSSSSSSTSDESDRMAAVNQSAASTSRQRPCHVMMKLDVHNRNRTVILPGHVCHSAGLRPSRANNDQGHVGSLLRHPNFWDMVERPGGPECGPCLTMKPQICPITNRGISCFGRPLNPIDQNVIWIRIGDRPSDNSFERLYLRHYKRVTDDSLKHLVQCSPNLVYLDVSWSGVTEKGVIEFKAGKPECKVICEHLDILSV